MFDSNSTTNISQAELDELFLDALELPEETRLVWLEDRCDGNPRLIKEIQSLVDAHEKSGEFLNDSQVAHHQAPIHIDYSGQCVGAWQLLSVIGRGGMGTVYKARRSDGRYEQVVAIKVGSATGLRSDLFNKERQVLANLNHPVITKILDAGDIPESNDAYLVMEYVNGPTLLDYVDQHQNLSDNEKARLIGTALDALHQAHCQGVIHCDIKPDNILVDDSDKLRLLDFGISRAVDELSEEQSMAINAITPAYSSPQRIAGEQPTIGDDVFGVGLLFGLLLCSSATRQHIVPKGVNGHIVEIADNLDVEPKAIFLKATQAQTEDRYSSAQAFNDDIRRWMQNQPVQAINGNAAYTLKKYFQRHQFSSIAASLAIGVMAVSAFAWNTHNEKNQFELAQEAQVAAALQLSRKISQGLDLRISQLPGSLPVRIATAEAALAQIEKVHEQQPDSAEIKAALASANLQLQSFYFQPSQMHVGDVGTGIDKLRTAYELAYDAYHLDRTVKNLMILVKSVRRISENLIIIDDEWDTPLLYEEELIAEYNEYKVEDSVYNVAHMAQIFVMFRIYMARGEHLQAKKLLDTAVKLHEYSIENLSDYNKNKLAVQKSRLIELNAVYAMITGDIDTAKRDFAWVVENFKDKKLWKDKRRALYAHRSLACIDLMKESPDYVSAVKQLKGASVIALNLTEGFPTAAGFRWEWLELNRLLEQIDDKGLEQSAVRGADQLAFEHAARCDRPILLHNPAPPAEGWKSVKAEMPFSLETILKPLN